MKTLLTIPIAIIAIFSISSCNNNTKNHTSNNTDLTNTHSSKIKDSTINECLIVSSEDSAKYISKQVIIKGEVENQITLTVDSLKKMKTAIIEDFKVVCQSGSNVKENKTCKGVLLKDILDKAKIKQNGHKDRNFYIVARATDNYKATFSWAEIFNNPTGENVYILFEENGKPINQQGDMILICKNDIKTGPRHVYWLSSIEVYKVN